MIGFVLFRFSIATPGFGFDPPVKLALNALFVTVVT